MSNRFEPNASASASRSVEVPVHGVERPGGMPESHGNDGSADQMSRLMLRVAGVCGFLWGSCAWLEWMLTPVLFSSVSGSAAELQFATQGLILRLGCVMITLIIPVCSWMLRDAKLLVYMFPAGLFVAFQLWQWF
ncbi:MAG: hypothetical protein AAF483_22955 [Planctomycetota bacterium]